MRKVGVIEGGLAQTIVVSMTARDANKNVQSMAFNIFNIFKYFLLKLKKKKTKQKIIRERKKVLKKK